MQSWNITDDDHDGGDHDGDDCDDPSSSASASEETEQASTAAKAIPTKRSAHIIFPLTSFYA